MFYTITKKIFGYVLLGSFAIFLNLFYLSDHRVQAQTKAELDESITEARNLFNQGSFEKSLEVIRKVIKGHMNNYQLRYLAAHDHWGEKRYSPATIHFQAAINAQKSTANTYIDLSLMQLESGQVNQALATASRGLRNSTVKPVKLYNIISRLNLKKGNFAEALNYAHKAKAAYNNAATVKTDQIEAIILEARAYLAMKEYSKADISLAWASDIQSHSLDQPINAYLENLRGYLFEIWSKNSEQSKSIDYKIKSKSFYNSALNNVKSDSLKKVIENNLKRL